MMMTKIFVTLCILYSITLLKSAMAGKLELQRIEYIPNSQNKVGEIDHLVVEHLQNGLTLVSFEGKLYEPISPDLMSICFYKKIDGKYTNETEGNICNYNFDFCEAMAGKNPDIGTQNVIAAVKFFAPNMVHECPYQKVYSVNNQTFDSRTYNIAMTPAEYMMSASLLLTQEVIFYFHVYYEIVANKN